MALLMDCSRLGRVNWLISGLVLILPNLDVIVLSDLMGPGMSPCLGRVSVAFWSSPCLSEGHRRDRGARLRAAGQQGPELLIFGNIRQSWRLKGRG